MERKVPLSILRRFIYDVFSNFSNLVLLHVVNNDLTTSPKSLRNYSNLNKLKINNDKIRAEIIQNFSS